MLPLLLPAWFLGAVLTPASTDCAGGCSRTVQVMVIILPPGAVLAGLLVGGATAAIAVWRGRSAVPWVLLAWLFPVSGILITYLLATAR